MTYSCSLQTLELYKARERSLHERANIISSAVDETAMKIESNLLNMGLLIEQVTKGSELSIEKVIEIKSKMM